MLFCIGGLMVNDGIAVSLGLSLVEMKYLEDFCVF